MRTVLRVTDGPSTRLGQLVLAGEVADEVPVMPAGLRTLDAYVLSVVLAGEGRYRDQSGRSERLRAGAHTVVPPGFGHTYGTSAGQGWTEVFAVFSGPLFDTLAQAGVLGEPGPRYPDPAPPVEALRAVLSTPPDTRRTAEHQLVALADWLVDLAGTGDPGEDPVVTAAAARLADDLTAEVDLHDLAAEHGLSYDAFRRRFTAHVGTPPAAYRTRRRLQTAASLLRLTDLTLREIARTLGFSDEFHLSRRFRREYGVPPSEYRR